MPTVEGVSSMGTLHHSPDLVLEIHDLGRQPGRMKRLQRDVPAPEGIGDDVIGGPAASPIALDLMLESAGDGVLVTGTAQVEVSGQCGRCLKPISDPTEFDLMELFLYPEAEPDDEEASRVVGESIDLEPLIRDTMVLDLPLPFDGRDWPDWLNWCDGTGRSNDDSWNFWITSGTRWKGRSLSYSYCVAN